MKKLQTAAMTLPVEPWDMGRGLSGDGGLERVWAREQWNTIAFASKAAKVIMDGLSVIRFESPILGTGSHGSAVIGHVSIARPDSSLCSE